MEIETVSKEEHFKDLEKYLEAEKAYKQALENMPERIKYEKIRKEFKKKYIQKEVLIDNQ